MQEEKTHLACETAGITWMVEGNPKAETLASEAPTNPVGCTSTCFRRFCRSWFVAMTPKVSLALSRFAPMSSCPTRSESRGRSVVARRSTGRRGDPENVGAQRSPGLPRFARNDDRGSAELFPAPARCCASGLSRLRPRGPAHALFDRRQRLVRLGAVGAAGLRHVRAPAAALAAKRG